MFNSGLNNNKTYFSIGYAKLNGNWKLTPQCSIKPYVVSECECNTRIQKKWGFFSIKYKKKKVIETLIQRHTKTYEASKRKEHQNLCEHSSIACP